MNHLTFVFQRRFLLSLSLSPYLSLSLSLSSLSVSLPHFPFIGRTSHCVHHSKINGSRERRLLSQLNLNSLLNIFWDAPQPQFPILSITCYDDKLSCLRGRTFRLIFFSRHLWCCQVQSLSAWREGGCNIRDKNFKCVSNFIQKGCTFLQPLISPSLPVSPSLLLCFFLLLCGQAPLWFIRLNLLRFVLGGACIRFERK